MTSLSQVCVALHPFSTLAPWPPPPQVLSDSYTAGREQFFRAYLEYQKAMEPLRDLASLGVLDVDMGPLCENIGLADLLFSLGPKPSVAGPQRDEWRALLARLYHEATVCTDATRTMDLLDGAGKASKGLSSHLKGYLSHERQGELADGIKNDLRPKEGKRGGVATICGGVHYQCAEEFATTSANAKQSDCLAGVVDEDTIPVLRSFLCSGATHECFLMFDLILIPHLMACPHERRGRVAHGRGGGGHSEAGRGGERRRRHAARGLAACSHRGDVQRGGRRRRVVDCKGGVGRLRGGGARSRLGARVGGGRCQAASCIRRGGEGTVCRARALVARAHAPVPDAALATRARRLLRCFRRLRLRLRLLPADRRRRRHRLCERDVVLARAHIWPVAGLLGPEDHLESREE